MDPAHTHEGAPADWHPNMNSDDVPGNNANCEAAHHPAPGAVIATLPSPRPELHFLPRYPAIAPLAWNNYGQLDGGRSPTPPRHDEYSRSRQRYAPEEPEERRLPVYEGAAQLGSSNVQQDYTSPYGEQVREDLPAEASQGQIDTGAPPRLLLFENFPGSSPQSQFNQPLPPASPTQQDPTHDLVDEKSRRKQEIFRQKGEAARVEAAQRQAKNPPAPTPPQPRKRRASTMDTLLTPAPPQPLHPHAPAYSYRPQALVPSNDPQLYQAYPNGLHWVPQQQHYAPSPPAPSQQYPEELMQQQSQYTFPPPPSQQYPGVLMDQSSQYTFPQAPFQQYPNVPMYPPSQYTFPPASFQQYPNAPMYQPSQYTFPGALPAPPLKPIDWEGVDQPITTVYADYKWPVKLYELSSSNSDCDFAEAFLHDYFESNIYTSSEHEWHAHTTAGFIKDGTRLSLLVLHNAAKPFTWYGAPESTTSIGVYGRYAHMHDEIHWTTITPGIKPFILDCVDKGLLTLKHNWTSDVKRASKKRFHRAYWLAANMLPLGGLLCHAIVPVPETPHDAWQVDDGFAISEDDLMCGWDGLQIDERESEKIWEKVLQGCVGVDVFGPGTEHLEIGGTERQFLEE